MTSAGALTFYAVRRDVEGETIESFDDVIAPELLSDPQLMIKDFETPTRESPESPARLYLWPGESQPPRWLAFLEDGNGSLTVPDTAQSRAVIVGNLLGHRECSRALRGGDARVFRQGGRRLHFRGTHGSRLVFQCRVCHPNEPRLPAGGGCNSPTLTGNKLGLHHEYHWGAA